MFFDENSADDFVVVNNSGKIGVINAQSNEIIPCKYSHISSYSGGYFVLREKLLVDDEIIIAPFKFRF